MELEGKHMLPSLTPEQADELLQIVEQDLGIPSTSWKWALAIGIGPYKRFSSGRKVKSPTNITEEVEKQ